MVGVRRTVKRRTLGAWIVPENLADYESAARAQERRERTMSSYARWPRAISPAIYGVIVKTRDSGRGGAMRARQSQRAPLLMVAPQGIAEGRAERRQPGFVVTPLRETLAIDRLADLLGACRPNTALGPVELKAGSIEL